MMRKIISFFAILLIVVGLVGSIFTYGIGIALEDRISFDKEWRLDSHGLDRLILESDDHVKIVFRRSHTGHNSIEVSGHFIEDVVDKLNQTEVGDGELHLDFTYRQPINFWFISFATREEQQITVLLNDATIKRLEASMSSNRITIVDGEAQEGSIQTSSGRIEVQGFQADTLLLSSSSGSIKGHDLVVTNTFTAKASSGSIELLRLQAHEQNVSTSSGSIRLEDLVGNLQAQASSGSIRLDGLQGEQTQLKTTSGSIRGSNMETHVAAEASSGSIRLEEVAGEVYIKASSGNVTLSQPSIISTEITTSSGSVRVTLPRDYAGHIDLRSNSGTIRAPHAKRETSDSLKVTTSSGSIRVDD